ncbi:MAG TPA: GTP-binding protein [Chloroflexota bacterium]|nr:GTP-binding protein [Chloroflexota bacterium]
MTRAPILIVVGGFLGAGKTTALVRATERLRGDGLRVALITNDQAGNLVDTAAGLRATESVAEIPGGCFCCRFDALHETLQMLLETARPDVVLAEAVGSCTDLAATVYQPLLQIGSADIRLGPLTVVVDGRRLRDKVRLSRLPRLPDTVTYLYDRQLAEADIILLNKVDLLAAEERSEVLAYLAATYPGAPVLPISAASGDGLDGWLGRFVDDAEAGRRVLDLDYDRYAEAEACLGWLNMEGTLSVPGGDGSAWVQAFLDAVGAQARAAGAELAHVKVWLETSTGIVVGNAVTNDTPPHVAVHGHPAGEARALVNARVAVAPELLRRWVEAALAQAGATIERPFSTTHIDAFSPARPAPLYRLAPRTAQNA